MNFKKMPYLIVIGLLLVIISFVGASSLMASDGTETLPHKKFFNKSDHPYKYKTKKNFSKEDMIKRFESKLDSAVEEGTITEEQKNAIIEKKTEMMEKFIEIKGLPPEERKAEILKLKEEFILWAEENDIDLNALWQGHGKKGRGHFKNKDNSMESSSLKSI